MGHGEVSAAKISAPFWAWAVGFGALTLLVLYLIYKARRGRCFGEKFRGLSRNARLLTLHSPFTGLSVSLMRLIFNLYLLATAAVIFVIDPTKLMILADIIGFFEGGHPIVGSPFMAEQSRPEEQVHLFILNDGTQVGSASLGNLVASVLPFVIAGLTGIGAFIAGPFMAIG